MAKEHYLRGIYKARLIKGLKREEHQLNYEQKLINSLHGYNPILGGCFGQKAGKIFQNKQKILVLSPSQASFLYPLKSEFTPLYLRAPDLQHDQYVYRRQPMT